MVFLYISLIRYSITVRLHKGRRGVWGGLEGDVITTQRFVFHRSLPIPVGLAMPSITPTNCCAGDSATSYSSSSCSYSASSPKSSLHPDHNPGIRLPIFTTYPSIQNWTKANWSKLESTSLLIMWLSVSTADRITYRYRSYAGMDVSFTPIILQFPYSTPEWRSRN